MQEGFDAEFVHDGAEGIRKALKWQPDVVLLDIRMPGKDGFYFLENFNQSNGMKVIAISALCNDVTLEKCRELGVADYITKPINLVDLRNKIQNLTL